MTAADGSDGWPLDGPGVAEETTTGKAILAGEHLVLYGVPALAVPVPQRTLHLRLGIRPGERLTLPEPLSSVAPRLSEILGDGLRGFVRMHITADIPTGAGLGSSAAFSVALGRALCRAAARWWGPRSEPLDEALEERARVLAGAVETHLHGRASGIDTTTVAEARPIRFELDPDGGARVSALKVSSVARFLLIDSGRRRSTARQVAGVAARRARERDVFALAARRGAEATSELERGLAAGDPALVARAVATLGDVLRGLDLEDEACRAMRSAAEGLGLAVKITGAGGGGFLLATAARDDVVEEARSALAARARVIDLPIPATHAQESS